MIKNVKKNAKRIVSFVLAVVMVLTMSSVSEFGRITANAADSVKLYFELPDGTTATDWVVNAWSDVTVEGDSEHAFRPETWGTGPIFPALLADDNLSGWGYVTVTGAVQGLQFVNRTGGEYNCWNSQITKLNLTEAYFAPSDGVWYKDANKSNEVKEAQIRNIFVVAGSPELTGGGCSIATTGNDKNIMKQDASDANKYTITYENVAAGSYEYKIVQDPENKGWDLAWGGSSNRQLELTAKSNVTFSIDLNDEEQKVDVKIVPLEEAENPGETEEPEFKNFIIHIKNEKNWEQPHVKFGAGSSWSAIEGFEDAMQDCGVKVDEDAVNEGWLTYSAKLPGSVSEVNGLFDNNKWGSNNQTENFKVNLSKDAEVWITFADAKNADVIKTSYEAPQTWANDLQVHFKNERNWEAVYAKFGATQNWNAIPGYEEFVTNGFGSQISEDEENEGWYSYHVGLNKDIEEVDGLFNCGDWGGTNQTANYAITGIAGDKQVWISYVDASTTNTNLAITEEMPQDWVGDELLTVARTYASDEEEEESENNPIINTDGTITFRYQDDTATSVYLCGNMNNWGDAIGNEDYAFKKGEDGIWTLTIALNAGSYEYKLVVNGNWITDPLNPKFANGNNAFVIKGEVASPVVKAPYVTFNLEDNGYHTVALCGSMNGWGDAIQDEQYAMHKNEDGVWSITLKLNTGSYQYKFVADGNNWLSDPLNENQESGGNSIVVVPEYYTYNVYYYDANEAHMSVDAADMHVWEKDGPEIGDLNFDELVDINGNQWLKGTIYTTATKLGIIPRSIGAWDWQTGNHFYENADKNLETNLYIVFGDDANTYTSVPQIKELRKRNVIVEYNRTNNDYDGWNIYSWNSGFGSATEIYAVDTNGKKYITVPVKDSTNDFDLAFCMRKTPEDAVKEEDKWAEKDGGDHAITVPANQLVVKAIFDEGQGVTRVLPYNKGYEMDGANNKITFLYRDDELMLTNTEDALEGRISVVVNGENHAMTYDVVNERYSFTLENAETGDFAYYYLVDGVKKLDAFNEKTTNFQEEENSVITYKHLDNLAITASLQNDKMDFDANNVLTVSLTGDDAEAFTTDEIASVTMDLEALGLGTKSINKELMQGVVSVKNTTSYGKKNIPVTMVDIYGNIYRTTTSVKVVANDEKNFDWDEAVIYFAVTDRFFDGNAENNDGVDKNGSLSYHGGDFAGLTQKLDYLQDLGVNTIWITPIVANSDTTTTKDGEVIESTGYHGYWASDFTTLNSHLGTEEEFGALITEAHKRGMKLMVDVVLNHSGYKDETTGFDPEDYFNQILVNEETNEYIPMIRDAAHTVSGDDVYSSLAGLPDFMTEDAAVRDQLIAWQVDWMERFDIDFFRVDTVKHVDATTWQAFKNELTKANPDFKMIGELSGHGYTSSQLGIGGMDSLLDFDFNDQAQSFVTGNLNAVENFMAGRNASINNTQTVGAFLSSHDEDGLVYKLINQNHLTEEDALNKFKVAASLQMTAKGQTVIYYGEEIGLYGANDYPAQTNRYDFDWEEAENQAADDNSMLNHYKKLLAIRNNHKALFARGNRSAVAVDDAAGYDVFSRSYDKDTLYVGLNIKDEAQNVTFAVNGKAGDTYKDLYNGKTYKVAADKTITVEIPAAANGGTVVMEKQKSVIESVISSIKDRVNNTANKVVSAIRDLFDKGNPGNNKRMAKQAGVKMAPDTGEDMSPADAQVVADASAPAAIEDGEEVLGASNPTTKSTPVLPIAAGVCVVAALGGATAFYFKRKQTK